MTATVIYGTDFKRSNPRADRAFWIGPNPLETMAIEIMNHALAGSDTAPSEYCAPFVAPDGDCG